MNPIEPIRNLADRIRQETQELGLELVGYSIVPAMEAGGPDIMQVVFKMSPESLLTAEDRLAKRNKDDLDSQFGSLTAGLEAELASDSETEKIEAAKEGMKDLMKDFMDE